MSFSLKCVHSSSTSRYWLHPTKPLAMHQASSIIRTVWDYCSDQYRYLRYLDGGQVVDAWFSVDGAIMYTLESTGVVIVWSVKRQSSSGTLPLLADGEAEGLLLASVCEERSGVVELCVLTKGLHLFQLSFDTRRPAVYVRKCVDVWRPGVPPKSLVFLSPTNEGVTAALLAGDGSEATFYAFDQSPDSVPVTKMKPTDGSLTAMAKCGASNIFLLSAAGYLTSVRGESIEQIATTAGKVTSLWHGVGGTCIVMTEQGALSVLESCESAGIRILPLRFTQSCGVVQACSSVDTALLVQSDGTVQVIDIRSSSLVRSSTTSKLPPDCRVVGSHSEGIVCSDGWKIVELRGAEQTDKCLSGMDRGVRITALSVVVPLMWVGYSDGEIVTYVLDGEEWRKRSEYSCDQTPVWISSVKGSREAYVVFGDDGHVGLLHESSDMGDLQMLQEFNFDSEKCKRVEAVPGGPGRGDDRYCIAEIGESIVLYEIYRLGKSLVHSALRKFKWEQDCKWCLSSHATFMTVLRHAEGKSEIEISQVLNSVGRICTDADIQSITLPEEAVCWQAMITSDDERYGGRVGVVHNPLPSIRYAALLSSPGVGQHVLVLKLGPGISNTCARLLTDGSMTSLAISGGLLYLGNLDGTVEIWKIKEWSESSGMQGLHECPPNEPRDVVVAAREMGLCRKWLPPEEALSVRLGCTVPSEADHRTVSSTQSSIVERAFNSMDRFDYSRSSQGSL